MTIMQINSIQITVLLILSQLTNLYLSTKLFDNNGPCNIAGNFSRVAINSVIKEMNWKNAIIFYDSCTELDMYSLVLNDNPMKHVLYNIDNFNETSVTPIFESLFHGAAMRDVNFIVISKADSAESLMKQAVDWGSEAKLNYLIMFFCKWLVISRSSDEMWWQDANRNLNNVAILEYNTENMQVSLYTLPWQSVDLKASVLWNGSSTDYVTLGYEPFPNQQYGLNRMSLTITAKPYARFVIKEDINGTAVYSGLCIDVLLQLASSLNFTYNLVEPPDGQFGGKKNGRWTGMVGQVHRGEADMVLGPLSIQANRASAIAFGTPYYYQKTSMAYRLHSGSEQGKGMVIRPLHWLVYAIVAASVVFMTVMYMIVQRFSRTSISPFIGNTNQWTDNLLLIYGGLFRQSNDRLPIHISSRTLLAFWSLFSIVIITSYSCNLVAFLATTKETRPFSSLEELVGLSSFKWGMIGGSFTENMFKSSHTEPVETAWKKVVSFSETDPDVLATKFSTLYKKMIDSPSFVYVGGVAAIQTASQNRCDVILVDDSNLPVQTLGVGVQTGSPLQDMVSERIQDMFELGIIGKWVINWEPKTNCGGPEKFKEIPVHLLSLEIAFYILASGIVLSIVILCFEIMWRPTRRS